jgi:tRNA uridine 5-carboxymethylaminomethyl modification enzyme
MFTSRAEYRTLLRQDNADIRLTPLSHKVGFASADRMSVVNNKLESVEKIKAIIQEIWAYPENVNPFLEVIGSSSLIQKQKVAQLILRPGIDLISLSTYIQPLSTALQSFSKEAIEQAEIQVKYERYIEKEEELVQRMSDMENMIIPDVFDYNKVQALSSEALQKFLKIKPRTLGQASRISGVNPSDIQILMVYMGR